MSNLEKGQANAALEALMLLPLAKRVDAANDMTIHIHRYGGNKWWSCITVPGEEREQTVWVSEDYSTSDNAFHFSDEAFSSIDHKLRMP